MAKKTTAVAVIKDTKLNKNLKSKLTCVYTLKTANQQ